MKLPHRRQFLHLAAGAAALPALPRLARHNPIRRGRCASSLAFQPADRGTFWRGLSLNRCRSDLASHSSLRTGRERAPIRHRNRRKGAPDGYTLLTGPSAPINATLYGKLNYNFVQDIAPVASVIAVPNVMVVHPAVPAKTVPEFIAYAKANPAKLNMASDGIGLSAIWLANCSK